MSEDNQDNEMKYRTLIENLPQRIFLKDKNSVYISCNYNYAQDLSIQPEQIAGKTDYDFYPKELAEKYRSDDMRIIETGKMEEIDEIDFKNGIEINVRIIKTPIKDENGNITGIIGIYGDITDRKKAEDALKESERKYREAYNKAEFYKDLLTHDMINIIQGISSSVNLYKIYEKSKNIIEKKEELFSIIEDQTIKAINLISNVRKLSDLENSSVIIEPTEIYKILKNSIESVKNSIQDKKKNIKFNYLNEEIMVKANEFLRDVFENILFNAVRYNENYFVEILIRISRTEKDKIKYIKMEFIDNGIGIHNSRKKIIFKKGWKEEKGGKGMGIGLSLVSTILRGYGGIIWVENRVKGDYTKGSNFILLIPEAEIVPKEF